MSRRAANRGNGRVADPARGRDGPGTTARAKAAHPGTGEAEADGTTVGAPRAASSSVKGRRPRGGLAATHRTERAGQVAPRPSRPRRFRLSGKSRSTVGRSSGLRKKPIMAILFGTAVAGVSELRVIQAAFGGPRHGFPRVRFGLAWEPGFIEARSAGKGDAGDGRVSPVSRRPWSPATERPPRINAP